MDATVLQTLWFILIGVIITGYFLLDGFDLGIGILYPFIAKTEREKAILRVSVGPLWDGNEVWLLTAGGALFAAFAPAYATSFSGFYLAIMLVLFGLIVRAAAIEFRYYDEGWKKLWDICFFIGSFLPALLFGVAVGNIVRGIPLNINGDYTGTFFQLLNPYSLLMGLLGFAVFVWHGANFGGLKVPFSGRLHKRLAKVRKYSQWTSLALAIAVTAYSHVLLKPVLPAGFPGVLRIVFGVLLFASLLYGLLAGIKRQDVSSFIASSAVIVSLVGLLASTLWPNLIVATNPVLSITVANAGGSNLALTAMAIITAIGLPLVLFYHYLIYKAFHGRIKEEDLVY
jgi:cytochrome d ubiquinol oxidase subunit II